MRAACFNEGVSLMYAALLLVGLRTSQKKETPVQISGAVKNDVTRDYKL